MKKQLNDMHSLRYSNVVCDGQREYSVCPCFAECQINGFDYESSLICNRSAKLGELFSQAKIKTLFIGKEDVSCLPQGGIQPESFLDVRNQHYRATKSILAALLGYCGVDSITNYPNQEVHFAEEGLLHKYFALTNHYHCAFKSISKKGKKHGIKSTDIMWSNCAAIVRQEIAVLQPEVIVIQAGWSAREKTASKNRVEGVSAYFDENWIITENSDVFGMYEAYNNKTKKKCYIIGSYHPSFHLWNNEKYLLPLKARVQKVKELLEG